MQSHSPQWRLIGYVSVAHGSVHTMELTYAALLSRIDDAFGSGLFVLGIVATAFAFTFGASALPSGLLVDRLGSRQVLYVCFLGAAGAALMAALSTNVAMLGLFLALLGLAIGLYHPAGISLIAQAAQQRGMALGYHGVAGNIGVAVAPALAVGLAEAFSWRAAYFFLAGLGVLVALMIRGVQLRETEASETAAAPTAVPASAAPQAPPAPLLSPTLLPLLLVYAVFVLNGFIYRGSMTFLPVHIEEHLHISFLGMDEAALAGSLTTLALLAGAAGQLFGGALSQRYKLEPLALPFALMVAPALLLMGISGGLALVAAAALFVFFNFGSQPVYTGLIADYSPRRALGRSFGISYFAAFGLGSTAAAFAGFLADRWGTDSVFLALAGFACITLALAAAIWRLSRPARPLDASGR
jgi:MFS family permease